MELMSEGPPNPEDFVTLDDVFSGIDLVDRQLIDLLSRRFALVRAAAKLNDGRFNLDDEERRRAVLSAIRRRAFELGVPVGLVGDFWDRLFDASVAFERQARERLRAGNE